MIYFDPEKLWHPTLQTYHISPNLLAKYSSLIFPVCFCHIVGICSTFLAKSFEQQANVCYFLMYGVLPGGVFDGATLNPPRGVVKSTWGNHQLAPGNPTLWRRVPVTTIQKPFGWSDPFRKNSLNLVVPWTNFLHNDIAMFLRLAAS